MSRVAKKMHVSCLLKGVLCVIEKGDCNNQTGIYTVVLDDSLGYSPAFINIYRRNEEGFNTDIFLGLITRSGVTLFTVRNLDSLNMNLGRGHVLGHPKLDLS